MARGYTVATIALALQVPPKWVDNVLSHFEIPAVRQGRQGIARQMAPAAVMQLAIVKDLVETLRVPLARAISAARDLLSDGHLSVGPELIVTVDREARWKMLAGTLELAIEAAPLPKRGRPGGKAKRGA